jgi:hypothetical protein
MKNLQDYQNQKFFMYNGKKYTTEMLYLDVLESFDKDKINLDIVRDMAHFFRMFFDTHEQRLKYHESMEQYQKLMTEALKSYWGISAEVVFDFDLPIVGIKATCNDGREVVL